MSKHIFKFHIRSNTLRGMRRERLIYSGNTTKQQVIRLKLLELVCNSFFAARHRISKPIVQLQERLSSKLGNQRSPASNQTQTVASFSSEQLTKPHSVLSGRSRQPFIQPNMIENRQNIRTRLSFTLELFRKMEPYQGEMNLLDKVSKFKGKRIVS